MSEIKITTRVEGKGFEESLAFARGFIKRNPQLFAELFASTFNKRVENRVLAGGGKSAGGSTGGGDSTSLTSLAMIAIRDPHLYFADVKIRDNGMTVEVGHKIPNIPLDSREGSRGSLARFLDNIGRVPYARGTWDSYSSRTEDAFHIRVFGTRTFSTDDDSSFVKAGKYVHGLRLWATFMGKSRSKKGKEFQYSVNKPYRARTLQLLYDTVSGVKKKVKAKPKPKVSDVDPASFDEDLSVIYSMLQSGDLTREEAWTEIGELGLTQDQVIQYRPEFRFHRLSKLTVSFGGTILQQGNTEDDPSVDTQFGLSDAASSSIAQQMAALGKLRTEAEGLELFKNPSRWPKSVFRWHPGVKKRDWFTDINDQPYDSDAHDMLDVFAKEIFRKVK